MPNKDQDDIQRPNNHITELQNIVRKEKAEKGKLQEIISGQEAQINEFKGQLATKEGERVCLVEEVEQREAIIENKDQLVCDLAQQNLEQKDQIDDLLMSKKTQVPANFDRQSNDTNFDKTLEIFIQKLLSKGSDKDVLAQLKEAAIQEYMAVHDQIGVYKNKIDVKDKTINEQKKLYYEAELVQSLDLDKIKSDKDRHNNKPAKDQLKIEMPCSKNS